MHWQFMLAKVWGLSNNREADKTIKSVVLA